MNILVGIDFGESSHQIAQAAALLARGLGGKIWLVHVAEPDPEFVGYEADSTPMRDVVAKRYHAEHQALQTIAQTLRDDGLDCVALLVQGATASTLLHEADKVAADIIVVGSQGKGAVKRLLLGSTSEGVLHRATVPVYVVPVR